MPKKGGKKKKQPQGPLSGGPDEVQGSESSPGAASGVEPPAQTTNQPLSSQPPQSGGTRGPGGFERGRGLSHQEQQPGQAQTWRQEQSLPAQVTEQWQEQSRALAEEEWTTVGQQRASRGQGMRAPRGRGETSGPGSGRGQRSGPPQKRAWKDQGPRSGPPQQNAWGGQKTGAVEMPVSQQTETKKTQQPHPSTWQQPAAKTTSLPRVSIKSEGSARKAADDETVTKALSEISLKEKQSTSTVLVSEDVKKKVPTEIFKLPQRKDPNKAGTLGCKISVLTNMMRIIFGTEFKPDVVHYDVDIVPDRPKYLMRPAFIEAQAILFPGRFPAYDGKKNAYSAGLLPFGNTAAVEVTVRNEDNNRRNFKVTLKKAADGELNLSWLKNVKPGTPETDQRCIQALDIILRMAPVLRTTPVGRSFFTRPAPDQVMPLGGGMDCWVGLFQSAVLGWKPFLNVDVAHKGFPTPQPVLELIKTICGCNGQGGGNRPPHRGQTGRQTYNQGPTELTVDLIQQHWEDINRFLQGLKVVYKIPGKENSKRTQRVNQLEQCPRYNSFDHNGHIISIEQYYRLQKEYQIQYPLFPCLWVGGRDRQIHVPLELCEIVEGQATQKKLNENQTSQMIRHAATGTQDRKRKIMEAFDKMGYNDDPCMKEFGISVSGKFEEIPARILNPPSLSYKNRDVNVTKGQWNPGEFLQPNSSISGDNTWTILNLNFRTDDSELSNFARQLREIAKKHFDVTIGKPCTPFKKLGTRRNCARDLKSYFDDQKKNKINLVVVIIPEIKGLYCLVKQVAELQSDMLTQCLKSKTLKKIENDRTPATITNILLKINAKLNGINHKISSQQKFGLPACLDEPCMIVGADVTHPSPDAKDIPSIAAVVASHDRQALFKYNAEIRLQPPREETILEFAEIMKIQLEYFYEKTGWWPLRIIYYRDGVGEGYFQRILQHELMAIRTACQRLQQKVGYKYEPKITFLVVQKRHHTRFFPMENKDSDDAHKHFNVKAGTVVDTEITHPTDIDFFLVSHASIQGTARPTKYRCLWDDADMSQDEMEQLTYYLCHLFARCNRSVSYPAPTYYAHLAAFRARNLIQNVRIDLTDLLQEQLRKLNIRPGVLKGTPMFFV